MVRDISSQEARVDSHFQHGKWIASMQHARLAVYMCAVLVLTVLTVLT